MSTLQMEVIQSLDGLSDENLQFLPDMIMQPRQEMPSASPTVKRQLGILKGETLFDPNFDLDEDNEEIARMFGAID